MATCYVLEVIRAEGVCWTPSIFSKAPDLYIKVRLGREETKTQTVKKSISPEWNETFTFKTDSPSPDLVVKLKDNSSRFPRKRCIGIATVKLYDIFKDDGEAKLELHSPSDSSSRRVTATVLLRLEVIDERQRAEAELEATVKSIVRFNRMDQAIDESARDLDQAQDGLDYQRESLQSLADLVEKIGVFKRLIDSIAMIHPYINVTWKVISALYELALQKIELDERIVDLIHLMAGIFDFVNQIDLLLDKIDYLQSRIVDFLTQTTECCLFIRQYSKARLTTYMLTLVDISAKVGEFEERFQDLRQSLVEGTNLHTAFVSSRVSEKVDVMYLKQQLSPVEMETSIRPECLPGTRTKYLEDIMGWLFSDSSQNILWLRGVAGTGKSTISKTISELCSTMGRRGAYLFFVRRKSDPESVIRTIAYRLAKFDKIIATRMLESMRGLDDVLSASLDRQFQKLLYEPLMAVAGSLQGPIAVILDSLDECGTVETRSALMKLLREAFPRLPAAFRFLITSRTEPDFVRNLMNHPSVYHLELDLTSDASFNDVRQYIDHELHDIVEDLEIVLPSEWPLSKAVELLSRTADGLFVWASTAIKQIRSRRDNPIDALEMLLSYCESRETMPHSGNRVELSGLYDTILANSGISWDDPLSRDRFVHILGLIILGKTPLSIKSLDGILGLPLKSSSRFVIALLQSVIVYTPGDYDTPVRVFHTSFSDYFFAPERYEKPWFIDNFKQRVSIAERCFLVMDRELRFNICDLDSSFVRNDQVPEIDEAIKHNIPQYLEYACLFWAEHLCGIPSPGRSSDPGVLPELLSKFARCHLLYWLEVLSLTRHFRRKAGRALLEAAVWAATECQELSSFLWDAYWLISIFSSPISESVPHIYLSALSLTRGVSKVADHYSDSHPAIQVRRFGTVPPVPCMKVFKKPTKEYFSLGGVYAVAFSPDGKHIASGFDEGSICVWDAESGEIIFEPFKAHDAAVVSVSFSRDGNLVASASFDSSIFVWDTQIGRCIAECLAEDSGPVFSVVFSPCGAQIASGWSDKTIKIWEARTGILVRELFGHGGVVCSVAYSPDGTKIASGSMDETIRIWDAKDGELTAGPFRRHTECVYSVDFSPDGRYVASGSGDRSIHVWDAETGKLVSGSFFCHLGTIFSIKFSPNGEHIVSGSSDKQICVWDAKSGRLVSGPFKGHTAAVLSVTFSPDGKRIASGSVDDTLRIWNAESGKITADPIEGHTDYVYTLAISPGGTMIASGSGDRTISVWDSDTGKRISGPFRGHFGAVLSLAFTPNGRSIVSGSADETILIRDTESGEPISSLPEGRDGIIFSGMYLPGGRVMPGFYDRTFRVSIAEDGGVVFDPYEGHTGAVFAVAVSSDGRFVASGSADKTLRIWDARDGKFVAGPLEGHEGWVISVAFSPGGLRIVSGSRDKTIRIWDADSYEPICIIRGHTGTVCSVAFSPDGATIVSGSYDKTICTWDGWDGERIIGPIRGHEDYVYSVDFSHDGKMIASSSEDGTIRIWDARSGELVAGPFEGHTDSVRSVKFSRYSRHIVSGSRDKTIRVWDVEYGANYSSERSLQNGGFENVSDADHRLDAIAGRREGDSFNHSHPSWDISDDGWLRGENGELLIWVPQNMRPTLRQPSNTLLFNCNFSTKLDFESSIVGRGWYERHLE